MAWPRPPLPFGVPRPRTGNPRLLRPRLQDVCRASRTPTGLLDLARWFVATAFAHRILVVELPKTVWAGQPVGERRKGLNADEERGELADRAKELALGALLSVLKGSRVEGLERREHELPAVAKDRPTVSEIGTQLKIEIAGGDTLEHYLRRFEDEEREAPLVGHRALLENIGRGEAQRLVRKSSVSRLEPDGRDSDEAVDLIDDVADRVVGLVRQRDVPTDGQASESH